MTFPINSKLFFSDIEEQVVLPAVSKRMGIEGFGVKSEDGIIALPKASPKPSRESIHYEPVSYPTTIPLAPHTHIRP